MENEPERQWQIADPTQPIGGVEDVGKAVFIIILIICLLFALGYAIVQLISWAF